MKTIWISVLILACLPTTAGCKGDRGHAGSPAERMAEAIQQAKPMYDTLAAIRKSIPAPTAIRPKACPVEEMKTAAGQRPYLLKLTWNNLVQITGEEKLKSDVDFGGVFAALNDPKFDLVAGPQPELWKSPDPNRLREAFERYQAHKFAAIIYPTKVTEPVAGGVSFTPGSAKAWLLIFRLEDAALLCAAEVQAENSDSVRSSFRRIDGMSAAGQAAVKDDLRNNLQAAIREQLQTMTGGLQ
ncbi:MAG: hypothetical protein GYA57_12040 [Myxococcales bacterium]|nr:hypothetical protein [Myxococcales bacterium]